MKFLIITDTHLGLQKDNNIWLEETLDFFKEVIDVCKFNNIDYVFHLGDFFHERKSVGTKSIEYAKEIAKLFIDVKMVLTPGNHDLFSDKSLTPTSLSMLEPYNNIIIIKEKTVMFDNFLFLPWGNYPDREMKICLGHFPIKGFSMNNYAICQSEEYIPEMFKSFDYVFSGHFHHPTEKQINNTRFIYVGSPFQHNFGDVDDIRGYYIFNNESNQCIFNEYKHAPKFKNVIANEELEFNDIEGNIIKLIWLKSFGKIKDSKILECIQKKNPRLLFTDFSNFNNEIIERQDKCELSEIKIQGALDVLYEYLDIIEYPKYINRKILNTLIVKFNERIEAKQ